jgi:hypothetical protein
LLTRNFNISLKKILFKYTPVFSADRLPAFGSPAGASEARRSVRSKKPLCKLIHSAAMRSISGQPLIASLREEKCPNRFKREKTARTGVFLFLNRKSLPYRLKRVTGEFKRSFFSKAPIFYFYRFIYEKY